MKSVNFAVWGQGIWKHNKKLHKHSKRRIFKVTTLTYFDGILITGNTDIYHINALNEFSWKYQICSNATLM